MEWEAEDEMTKGNFSKAREKFDMLLKRDKSKVKLCLLGKADCLALEGHLSESLPLYSEAFQCGKVHPDRLLRFVNALSKLIVYEGDSSEQPREDNSGLQCRVCTGILYDPVTISCGHSFCKLCLEKQESKSCERCKCPFSHSPKKTNVILQNVLEKSFDKEMEATRLRLEGNQLHRKKKSVEAIEKYREAEKLSKSDHLIPSNLACVFLSLGNFEEALEKANKTCELQPTWPKGFYRRGCALLGLQQKVEAAVSFLHCLVRDRDNKGVQTSLTKLIHEVITQDVSASTSCKQEKTPGTGDDVCTSETTDPILQRLRNLLTLVEQSKSYGNIKEKCPEDDEPDIKRLKFLKCCSTEDLECTLCCRLFYEPVTTPCGHVFCRSCLNCNLDHRPTCPICRFSLSKFLAERRQNITVNITQLIESTLPEECAERKQIHEEEMEKLASVADDTTEDVPIFVCTLAFPSQSCPLHIFEPRYRLMVRQCMESGSKQFGMCVPHDEKGFVDYGVMLEINDLQYLPDGRSFLDCVGGRRFKVLERGMQSGYHTAKVEWIKDVPIPEEQLDEVKTLHQNVYNEAKAWFGNLPLVPRRRIVNMFSPMPNCDAEQLNLPQGPSWMWWLLGVCPTPEQYQLEFISMTCVKSRLEKLRQLIRSMPI
ncbi:LON peptidase N-terminal domain and RING finger protein 3-like isoform X1 [Montipora capricornis]|uniref:LON peptidase N-terminal domain and RING finger protein 3-like isoform X1 n=1 Tax=Montipora capricornis TaxID=246305 RepID=UPI0035F1CA46